MTARILLALCVVVVPLSRAIGGELAVAFDYANAQMTADYLKSGRVDDDAITRLLALDGTRGLLQKLGASEDQASANLRTLFDHNGSPSSFQYRWIRKSIDRHREFLAELIDREDEIRQRCVGSLAPYVGDQDLSVTVHFLLGGHSSGFTLGDDQHFYIALHHYQGDVASIINSCVHELFHNVQRAHYDMKPASDRLSESDLGLAYAHAFIAFIFQEGTASYVADLNQLDDANPHIRELKEHAAVNPYREQDIFYLISRLLLDVRTHPERLDAAGYESLYNILLGWNWNNPGYYAGYRMAQVVLENKGAEALQQYLRRDPVHFFADYIALSGSTGPAYTEDFAALIDELRQRIDEPAVATPDS